MNEEIESESGDRYCEMIIKGRNNITYEIFKEAEFEPVNHDIPEGAMPLHGPFLGHKTEIVIDDPDKVLSEDGKHSVTLSQKDNDYLEEFHNMFFLLNLVDQDECLEALKFAKEHSERVAVKYPVGDLLGGTAFIEIVFGD